MPFGNAILDLIGDKDPTLAMLAALHGQGAGTTPAAAASTQGAAAGAPGAQVAALGHTPPAATPAATPAAPPLASGAQQSPPELMELYTQLIKRQRRADMINSGIGMIASGFAAPENRQRVTTALDPRPASAENDPVSMASNLLKFQQAQAIIAQRAANRAALPSIAKQYNMDLPTVQYLFDQDKLEDVLSELIKPNRQLADLADGRKAVVDLTTGLPVGEPIGPAKPRELELRQDGNGQWLAFDKETGMPVGDPQGAPNRVELKLEQDAKTGEWIAVNPYTGKPVHTFGNVSGATENEKLWRAANEDRLARGMQPISLSDFIAQTGRARAGASNLGPNGIDYGNPPTDMAWKRDAQGNIMIDEETGSPIAVVIKGSKSDVKATEAADKATRKEDQQRLSAGLVSRSIDDIFNLVEMHNDSWTTPVFGMGALAKYFPGTVAKSIAGSLDTIKANIGFDKLQQMRENSPTGGALGQVSDFENKLLQSTFGVLEQEQSDRVTIRNLMRVKKMTEAIIHKGVKTDAEAQAIFDEADREADAFFAKLGRGNKTPKSDGSDVQDLIEKYRTKGK